MYKACKQIKVMYAQQYERENSWLMFNKPISDDKGKEK
jgi:hypothetical protein